VRVPPEREWLAKDTIPDLERCWQFIERAVKGKLPRRVFVAADWRKPATWTRAGEDTLFIGMDDPGAVSNPRGFFLHQVAREMARLALLELSRGGAGREQSLFLLEGMIEIYAHEFRGSSRGLEAAWVLSHLMDQTGNLGLSRSSPWSEFSRGRRDLCVTSPGVTFLLTCRQLYGREKLLKLFEGLRNQGLAEACQSAFGAPAASLEQAWLQKVRDYDPTPDVTVTAEADAPALRQAVVDPPASPAGATVQMRLSIDDPSGDLLPCGIFVSDLRSGKVRQARAVEDAGGKYLLAEIPIEADAAPGKYGLRVTAVDAAGNVRTWSREYTLVR
jgi:hypothetical protein